MAGSTTRRVAIRVGLTFLVAALLGTAANLISPNGIPWIEDWSQYIEAKARKAGLVLADLDDTRRLLEEGNAFFFDARAMEDYDAGHIPGAMSFPYDPYETISERFQMYAGLLTPGQTIVTYCSGKECDESFLLAGFLKDQGLTNIILFAGGWEVWSATEGQE